MMDDPRNRVPPPHPRGNRGHCPENCADDLRGAGVRGIMGNAHRDLVEIRLNANK
jgi:hypothetical protein